MPHNDGVRAHRNPSRPARIVGSIPSRKAARSDVTTLARLPPRVTLNEEFVILAQLLRELPDPAYQASWYQSNTHDHALSARSA